MIEDCDLGFWLEQIFVFVRIYLHYLLCLVFPAYGSVKWVLMKMCKRANF
jgi:hypothetical protein